MPGPGGNPFVKLTKQSVIGHLKATNSRDEDVLFAQKARLVAPQKNLKLRGWICIVCGTLFTVTITSSSPSDVLLLPACSFLTRIFEFPCEQT